MAQLGGYRSNYDAQRERKNSIVGCAMETQRPKGGIVVGRVCPYNERFPGDEQVRGEINTQHDKHYRQAKEFYSATLL